MSTIDDIPRFNCHNLLKKHNFAGERLEVEGLDSISVIFLEGKAKTSFFRLQSFPSYGFESMESSKYFLEGDKFHYSFVCEILGGGGLAETPPKR